MFLSPRHAEIIQLAKEKGRVLVDDLAGHFNVTPQTIRKDLNELCDERMLSRTHGGAMLSSGVENLAYESRRHIAAAEKVVIGQQAARLIPNNCSLFINIGTTTEEVARALVHHEGLLVITNNIHVAHILQGSPAIEVIVAGGVLRHGDGGIVGEAAVDFIRQFRVDFAIVGVSAIDSDGSLLDFDYREVRVAKAILEGSRRCILVADAMKFARSAPVRIGHISQIDHLVTDEAPPAAVAALLREHDIGIDVVGTTD